MENKRSQELIERYLDGNATPEEKLQVEAALNRHMERSEELRTPEEIVKASRRIKQNVFDIIDEPVVRRANYRLLPYVAAVLVLLGGFVFWKLQIQQKESSNDKNITYVLADAQQVLPGGNRATISFDNGPTLTLDENQNGIIIGDQDITYRDGSSLLEEKSDTRRISYATLTTPKGGTYQITLPDGSKVWLNAASSLRYPVKFTDHERIVELEGEAYFEVTHQLSKGKNQLETFAPFKVKTKRQLVEVLGTGFNVSDYEDEEETQTTLVEGSVNILASSGGNQTLLIPGQQAVIYKNKTTVNTVDVEQFTAWKDGFFYFDRLSPHVALSQLARWYDIDVVYQTAVPKARVFGMIDRGKNLGSVLTSLERSGLNFKLVENNNRRTLIVLGEK